MTVRHVDPRLGGTLIRWAGGFQWQWPHLLVHVQWTRHRMPTRRPHL